MRLLQWWGGDHVSGVFKNVGGWEGLKIGLLPPPPLTCIFLEEPYLKQRMGANILIGLKMLLRTKFFMCYINIRAEEWKETLMYELYQHLPNVWVISPDCELLESTHQCVSLFTSDNVGKTSAGLFGGAITAWKRAIRKVFFRAMKCISAIHPRLTHDETGSFSPQLLL